MKDLEKLTLEDWREIVYMLAEDYLDLGCPLIFSGVITRGKIKSSTVEKICDCQLDEHNICRVFRGDGDQEEQMKELTECVVRWLIYLKEQGGVI